MYIYHINVIGIFLQLCRYL